MIYLAWYVAIGVVFVFVNILLNKDRNDIEFVQSVHKFWGSVKSKNINLIYQSFPGMLSSLGAGLVAVVLWPYVSYILLIDKFRKNSNVEKKFEVVKENLQEQMTIQEIEQRERVFDPMCAVSDLPFGHLYNAWKTFREGIESQSEIWTFSTNWKTSWGGEESKNGYVVVKGESIGPHFLTPWKTIRSD